MPVRGLGILFMSRLRATQSRAGIWLGVLVFGCAFFVRVVYLYESSDNPTFRAPVVDSATYDLTAREAVEGGTITRGFFWQQFFYPFFLSVVYFFSNCSIVWAKVIQVLLGSATCVITYCLGKRIFGRAAGVSAGLMAAVYGPLIFFEAELLSAGWSAFWAAALILLFLKTAEKRSLRLCFVLGLCSALSVITRPNFIPFLLAAGVWLAVVCIRQESFGRKFVKGALLVLVGFCAVAAPVAVKNRQVTGRFSFLPGTSGLNAYIGNNPDFEAVALRPGLEWKRVVELPLRRGFITPKQRERFYYSETLRYAWQQPGRFVKTLGRKCVEFGSSREMPGHIDIYMFRRWSGLLGFLVWKVGGFGFPFGVLLPLSFLGIAAYWKKIPAPLLLFVVFYSASVILTHVEARYRAGVIIPMCIVAAGGLVRIIELARGRQWSNLTGGCLLCVAAGILCSMAGPFYSERNIDYESELQYVVGGYLQDRGMTGRAAEAYRKAIALRPDYLEAYQNLGLLLTGEGRLKEASAHYIKSLAVFPKDAGLYEGLGIVLFQDGKFSKAAEYYRKAIELDPYKATAYDNLGTALFKLNQVDKAIENYNKAVALNPYDAGTHSRFGIVLGTEDRMAEAIEHFEASLRLRPNQADTLSNLAGALASLGEFDKATKKFKAALRMAPADADIYFKWGWCLHRQGRIDEAIDAYQTALRLEPGHRRARQALNALIKAKYDRQSGQ